MSAFWHWYYDSVPLSAFIFVFAAEILAGLLVHAAYWLIEKRNK